MIEKLNIQRDAEIKSKNEMIDKLKGKYKRLRSSLHQFKENGKDLEEKQAEIEMQKQMLVSSVRESQTNLNTDLS